MRLSEIKSENQLIIKLKEIDINFDEEYELIINTHNFMKTHRIGSSRHRILLNNINNFEIRINNFMSMGFLPDRDINNIRLKIRKYAKNLELIKKEIP
jgi:hypothetical protein